MIVNIQNQDGTIAYNINEISDESQRVEARVIINKVSTLEAIKEGLTLATITHRRNLEQICINNPEAMVVADNSDSSEDEIETVEEENSTEETPES